MHTTFIDLHRLVRNLNCAVSVRNFDWAMSIYFTNYSMGNVARIWSEQVLYFVACQLVIKYKTC